MLKQDCTFLKKARFPVSCFSALLLLWLMMLLCDGCLFTPRETGQGSGSGNYQTQTEPAIGLVNIEYGLENFELSTYGKAFAEGSIVMEFDNEGVGNPDEFLDWTKEQEEALMTLILVGNVDRVEVSWLDSDPDLIEESIDVKYYQDLPYRVVVTRGVTQQVFSGQVDLWFADDGQGLWMINKWIDRGDGSQNNTWGWLRLKKEIEW